MNNKPNWLPDLFPINPWTEDTIDKLYVIFKNNFIDDQPKYNGKNIWVFPEKYNDKEVIFWHLIEREDIALGERVADFRRAERLPWARPTIDNCMCPEVVHWDYEEGDGSIHTYVWLKDFDYLIVLKKYKDGSRRLITGYWIEYSNTRNKLEKKYLQRVGIK